jgi:uncharacterized Zn finger protein
MARRARPTDRELVRSAREDERARLRAYWISRLSRARLDEPKIRRTSTSWIAEGEQLIGAKIGVPDPVRAEGRNLASSVWGRAWCEHLEKYSDFVNRLPRGRTYLRTGRVLHLILEPGLIRAIVEGRELYGQTIRIAILEETRRRALADVCSGTIDAAVDLVSGRLPRAVLESLTDPCSGLFPTPQEIELACSCPDAAYLCKHLAAVLYGVGVRLDSRPDLLFTLRGIDPEALISSVHGLFSARPPPPERRLAVADLATLFDIDLVPAPTPEATPDEPLLISRRELIEVGVPAHRITGWLQGELLLRTAQRGIYELTPEAWVHLEPMFES